MVNMGVAFPSFLAGSTTFFNVRFLFSISSIRCLEQVLFFLTGAKSKGSFFYVLSFLFFSDDDDCNGFFAFKLNCYLLFLWPN